MKVSPMLFLISNEFCDGPEQDRRVVEYQLSDGSRVTPGYIASMIEHHGAQAFQMIDGRWTEMKIVHNLMWHDGLAA